MKRLLALLTLSASFAASAATSETWSGLPEGGWPDAEVSTNVALTVDLAKVQEIRFSLNATSNTSSEVIVAVGSDADEDGDLAYEEAAFYFGLDCGSRYLVDCTTGEADTTIGETIVMKAREFDPSWNLLKIMKRGTGTIGESVTMEIENKKFVISVR